MSLDGVDLTMYMVEEMRRFIKNEFKPFLLDRIEQSRKRQIQNFLHPIRCPRKSLMKEEKTYMDNYENSYRQFYSGGERDHENNSLRNIKASIPSTQRKNDSKSYLGGKSNNWIFEENQSLSKQKLEEISNTSQTSQCSNKKQMMIKVDGVADTKDEECSNQREMEIQVEGEVEEAVDPKIQILEDSCEDVFEICDPTTLDTQKSLTQTTDIEEEQIVDTRDNGLIQKSFLARASDLKEAVNEERPMIVLLYKENLVIDTDLTSLPPSIRFVLQEFDDIFPEDRDQVYKDQVKLHDESESKKEKDAQGGILRQSFVTRREDLIFDPGIWTDNLDLRANPLQEEGNDAVRSPIQVPYVRAD